MSYYNGDYKATSANFMDYIDKDHNQNSCIFHSFKTFKYIKYIKMSTRCY